jgi:hypothetical protein
LNGGLTPGGGLASALYSLFSLVSEAAPAASAQRKPGQIKRQCVYLFGDLAAVTKGRSKPPRATKTVLEPQLEPGQGGTTCMGKLNWSSKDDSLACCPGPAPCIHAPPNPPIRPQNAHELAMSPTDPLGKSLLSVYTILCGLQRTSRSQLSRHHSSYLWLNGGVDVQQLSHQQLHPALQQGHLLITY